MLVPSPISASPTYDRCGTLAPSPIVGVLGLDEGADLAAGAERRCRAAGRRTGRRSRPSPITASSPWVRTTRAPGADLAVLERGVGPDHGVLADDGRAEQLGAGQEDHVGREHDVGVDPGGRGVHHRDALAHPLRRRCGGSARGRAWRAGRGRWRPRSASTSSIGKAPDRQPGLAGQADGVGEVVLALGVVVVEPRQRVGEELRVEGEDPGADLADLALRRRSRPSPR